jgi:hypothetical protein
MFYSFITLIFFNKTIVKVGKKVKDDKCLRIKRVLKNFSSVKKNYRHRSGHLYALTPILRVGLGI